MAISSVNPSVSSFSGSPANVNAVAALSKEAQQVQDKQESAVVSLSRQAQQLSRTEAQAAPAPQLQSSQTSPTAESTEAAAKETSEKPGIQFMEGESKGGRVNTYA